MVNEVVNGATICYSANTLSNENVAAITASYTERSRLLGHGNVDLENFKNRMDAMLDLNIDVFRPHTGT